MQPLAGNGLLARALWDYNLLTLVPVNPVGNDIDSSDKELKPMSRTLLPMIGLTIVAAVAGLSVVPTPALADSIFDVEHARANARAGRPVSPHDAEYLNRWGALSGTPGWRHRYNEDPGYDYGYGYYDESRYYRPRHYRPLR